MDWRWLLKSLAQWLKRNLIQAVLSAVIGALVGTVVQIVVVAVLVEGNQDLLARYPNHPMGRPGQASLFWGLLTSLLFGMFGYWRAVGTKRFVTGIVTLPFRLHKIFAQDGPRAASHLLWGAAIGLLASLTLNPYVGWLLAAGVLAFAGSILGRVVASLVSAVYYSVMRLINPARAQPLSTETSAVVGMMGTALSLVVAAFVPWLRLPLAIGCGVAAVALSRSGPPAPVAGAILLLLFGTDWSWADDGGWQEGGGTINSYMNTPGSDQVWRPGATGGGLGAPIGLGLGDMAGRGDQPGGGDKPGDKPGDGGRPGGGGRPGDDDKPGDGDKPDDGKPGGRVPYDQNHADRLGQLGHEITDPDLYERYERLVEQAEGGEIDPNELANLEAAQDRLAQQRHEEIVRQQEQATREHHQWRQQQEAEEAAREQVRRERERQVEAAERMIDRHSDDPEQQEQLRDFLERHRNDSPEDFERATQAIRDQTIEAEQQRNMGDAEEAREEADAYRQSQEFAEDTRDWANRANRILATAVPGGQRILDAQNAAQAAAEGYSEGGWQGALERAGANVLDNYTEGGASAALDAYHEGTGMGGFVDNFVENNTSQYDPRTYVERVREGGLGGLIDAALDARDARDSLRGGGGDHDGGDGVGIHRGGDEGGTPRHGDG
ncbi:MAG: hypothetical protein AB1758_26210, partial [Candidatus Eremiobacterota bacterium]